MDMQEKISQYSNSTNYNVKITSTTEDGTVTTIDYYKKDKKQAAIIEKELDEVQTKISMYNNGSRTDIFRDTEDEKLVQLDAGTSMEVGIYNQLESENKWQAFIQTFMISIKTEEYNGKECYVVSNTVDIETASFDVQTLYIDKETGLLLKNETDGTVTEREYEFDNVSDDIFTEPDVGLYTLQESN
jgi:hypothetical protein